MLHDIPATLEKRGRSAKKRMKRYLSLYLSLFFLILSMFIFYFFPSLDIAVSEWFYCGDGCFIGKTALAKFLRYIFYYFPSLLFLIFVVGWLKGRWRKGKAFLVENAFSQNLRLRGFKNALKPWWDAYEVSDRSMAFLLISLLAGPVLLVSIILKEHTHRPRPVHIHQFGGNMDFQPFYRFTGECQKNCSFVSGEAAHAFWTLGAAALAPPPFRLYTVGIAASYAVVTGFLRISFGGHFLSDVLFAALFVILILHLCWYCIFRW